MRTIATTIVCAAAIALAGPLSARAANTPETAPSTTTPSTSPVVKAADAVIVRPIGFASTVVGGLVFTLSLPVTALTKHTKAAADALVIKPARATFKRPLGDMDALAD